MKNDHRTCTYFIQKSTFLTTYLKKIPLLPHLSITWSLKTVPSSPVLNNNKQQYFSSLLFMARRSRKVLSPLLLNHAVFTYWIPTPPPTHC